MRRTALISCCAILMCAVAAAQAKTAKATAGGVLTKARMQQVLDAWSTMDLDKVAPYYSQAMDNPYYDLLPLKYKNFAEYREGVQKIFADYTQLKLTLNDDAEIHNAGSWAWSTATWHGDGVKKDGSKDAFDARWTAIWQKKGASWIIRHDHNSVPMQTPPK